MIFSFQDRLLAVILVLLAGVFCKPQPSENDTLPSADSSGKAGIRQTSSSSERVINPTGKTIISRFQPPPHYQRKTVDSPSFAHYLRHLPLKPHGAKVHYYNGRIKPNKGVYEAVIDMPIGSRDLHQFADAVIRLRADYLHQRKLYDRIHFDLTNGFEVGFERWRQGYRVQVEGNHTSWTDEPVQPASAQSLQSYLTFIYTYAGSLSLSRELKSVPVDSLQIGDVFIQGGTPGHAVIVVDVITHTRTEGRLFLLAQSYMPAQEIQILKNPADTALSPWYPAQFGEILETPEWRFGRADLMRFSK